LINNLDSPSPSSISYVERWDAKIGRVKGMQLSQFALGPKYTLWSYVNTASTR